MTDPSTAAARVLVRANERGPEFAVGHPYNPGAEVHGRLLSRMAGLERIAVNLVRIPPGKESAVYHVHYREEEWTYVLAGRGVVELDGANQAVGPGDFLGFAPGVAHQVRNPNPSSEDLELLVGGEILPDVDVADFPRLRRRLVRTGTKIAIYPLDAELPFLPPGVELPPAYFGIEPPKAPPRPLVRAGERGEARVYHHPQNPKGEAFLTPLSRPTGLRRVAVLHTRVPAGRDSFAHHVHQHDEEWMFVLSGRGFAELGDVEHPIGAGDFLGFPAGGEAHGVRAAEGEDLVYVQGGDAWSRRTIEIVDLPRARLRKTFVGTRSSATFPLDAAVEGSGAAKK
jgi:quercetin 2,3-dioxygenase